MPWCTLSFEKATGPDAIVPSSGPEVPGAYALGISLASKRRSLFYSRCAASHRDDGLPADGKRILLTMTDLLREIPMNPIPDGAMSGFMRVRGGRQIRYACFSTGGENGTVVLLQGRNECIEKYFETISDLADRGFSCATFDWRGQGGSERLLKDPRRGHVRSFNDYAADLDQFFREVVLPDCRPPYSILAHSTGALIALLSVPQLANRVRRMVLCAPLLETQLRLPDPIIGRWARILYLFGLGRMYFAGFGKRGQELPFQTNPLTSDARRFERNQTLLRTHPDLFLGGPTIAWCRAASIAVRRISDPEYMAAIRVPTLFLAAGADGVVSTPTIERYGRALRSARVLTIDGARHELLQERDLYREQVLAAFTAFASTDGSDVFSMPLLEGGAL